MACYHPLKAWQVGINPDTGKAVMKVTSFDVHHLEQVANGTWVSCRSPGLSDTRVRSVLDFVEIPCGKCVGCRLEYSRQWANRCMLELEYHKSAYFCTFTYNNDFVPKSYYADPETGEAMQSLTLDKRDFQLFMKRLRKAVSCERSDQGDKIRFFAAGEYGDSTFRPHFHAIIFGLELNDLVPYSYRNGHTYYYSQWLQDRWSIKVRGVLSPLGNVLVAPVTWETCAYTARYVMKKLSGPESQFYSDFNISPPFTLMSRKPGIAHQWYVDHPDCFDYEYINISTDKGGRKFRPPKYYQRLYEIDDPEGSAEMKATRRLMAERAKSIELSRTNLPYLEYLTVKENALTDRIKSLKRIL